MKKKKIIIIIILLFILMIILGLGLNLFLKKEDNKVEEDITSKINEALNSSYLISYILNADIKVEDGYVIDEDIRWEVDGKEAQKGLNTSFDLGKNTTINIIDFTSVILFFLIMILK